MELNRQTAELALREASQSNPGAWADHSRYVAEACKNIALHCKHLSADQAYLLGLLHDIGRYAGVSSERHLKEFVANAVYDDYDRLVQLCDALAMPTGFCLLEKRFVDVTIRYGIHPATIDRWKKILEIKQLFESEMGCSIYTLLPGVVENSFR